MSKIKPIGVKVLVLADPIKEITKSGIILTEITPEIPDRGIVVDVGDRVKEISKGDYVIYNPMQAIRLTNNNQEYLLFQENTIIAKIND